MTAVHATAVSIAGRGVLLRGPPGAGKSDLALRLIASGAVLIADDQVLLSRVGDRILAAPPESIAGLIELRGVGIRRMAYCADVPIALLVDLVRPELVERLPDPKTEEFDGVGIPLLALAPFEASAAIKLQLALGTDGAAGQAHGRSGDRS